MRRLPATAGDPGASPSAPRRCGHDDGIRPLRRLGSPIRGPSALTDDWTRFWHLTFNIARNQWKLRFYGSVLGYFWQLVRPLLLFGVLYLFFTVIAHIGVGQGPSGHFYGTQLLGSIVLFTFFAEATAGAVRCVVDNEPLVRKIQFPRMVIPLSVVLLAGFNLSLNLIVVLIFGLIQGVRPMLTWLELPLIVGMLAVLSAGLAMLLASLFVSLRDTQPIWEVVSQVLFYASPVIIPLVVVQQKLSSTPALVRLYMINPLATVLQQFRHAMVNQRHAWRGRTARGASVAARPYRDHARVLCAWLRRLQPDCAERRRESLKRSRVDHGLTSHRVAAVTAASPVDDDEGGIYQSTQGIRDPQRPAFAPPSRQHIVEAVGRRDYVRLGSRLLALQPDAFEGEAERSR